MNVKDYHIKVAYIADGVYKITDGDDDVLSFSETGGKNRVLLTVFAKRPVSIVLAQLIYDQYYETDEWFFANGFQSWSLSREYKLGDRQYGLRSFGNLPAVRRFAAPTGDYDFTEYGKDLFHSHTYTYLRRGEKTEFFGTLNDRTGYTVFYADVREHVFAIEKDVEGVVIEGEYELFNVARFEGAYDEVFDAYFAAYPEKSTGRAGHLAGYTSWYNYFQDIDEGIILRDLEGLAAKAGSNANVFQIDDGYESMVGDWLETDKAKFPRGMAYIADEVHKKGYMAGLWLAPFSAQFKADLVRRHPDWFIRGKNGKKFIGGFAWNGFYVLDTELPQVRAYIKKVFDTVFDEWGFDMVKLDFLYSAGAVPRNGKSRGQLMHEAMDFLRECCRDKLLLGCGMPLVAGWGKADACRISCDVELSFKDRFYVSCTNQEIISARNAMNNTIFRRHLNGRIFANDPDVFFLRDGGAKPAKFNPEQKKLLARINRMFGDVLFVSDNVGEYDAEKLDILLASYKPFEGRIERAEYADQDTIEIVYVEDGVRRRLVYDTLTGKNVVEKI